MKNLRALAEGYFNDMAHSFFFKGPGFGAALLFLMACFDFRNTLFGFAASLVGYGYSVRYSTPKLLKEYGLITINCFFFGIAMPRLFQITPAFFLCFALGAMLLPLLTKAAFELLQHWKLSPNFIPYITMTWIVALVGKGGALAFQTLYSPEALSGKFHFSSNIVVRILVASLHALGDIFFLTNPIFGLCLTLLVVVFSARRAFFFFSGTAIATIISYSLSGGTGVWENGAFSFSAGLVGISLASFPEKFRWHTIYFFCAMSAVLSLAAKQFLASQALPPLCLGYVLTYWIAALSRIPRVNVSWAPRKQARSSSLVSKANQIFDNAS